MKKTILSSLIFTFLCTCSFSQTIDKAKLDQYFDQLQQHNKFMGSVAVSKNGMMLYTKTIGFADIENNLKANSVSKYRIGSISKTFTATLLLQAVEKGLISLEQSIDVYFPNIENAKKITISHLLNHRSGIHSFTDDASYMNWYTDAKSEKEMLDIIVAGGSDFEPDGQAQYSNSNYVLLSYILEKTYKETFESILKKNIVEPLGLKNTYLGKSIDTKSNEVYSYSFVGNWMKEKETDPSIPLGAGAIVSNPQDLILFTEALFNGKLLSASSLETMKKIKDSYGFGLFQLPFYDKVGYGHTGGIDGFSSAFTYFEDDKITYALTSNGANTNSNTISLIVLSEVFDKPYTIPEISSYKVTSEDLKPYLGTYASPQLPIKIVITRENNTLIAQATGQSSFPLEAMKKDVFSFEMAGIVLEFNVENKTLTLKQGGGAYVFTKE